MHSANGLAVNEVNISFHSINSPRQLKCTLVTCLSVKAIGQTCTVVQGTCCPKGLITLGQILFVVS